MSYRYSTPVPELKERITAREFYKLLAYELKNPRGEERADYRTAQICNAVYKFGGMGSGGSLQLENFMAKYPSFDDDPLESKEAIEKRRFRQHKKDAGMRASANKKKKQSKV